MIRLAAEKDLPALQKLCEGSAVGCRILAGIKAYGLSRGFFGVWVQHSAEGPTAVFCSLDGAWSVCAPGRFDSVEAIAMLRAVGGDSVSAREDTLSRLGIVPQSRFLEMRLRALPEIQWEESSIDQNPSPRFLYPILTSRAGDALQIPPFEPWYLDLSHRVRHHAARCVMLRADGQPAACAVAMAETEREALLGGVAVYPDKGGRGLGKQAVGALLSALEREGKVVHLICPGYREGFYRSLGFEPTSQVGEAPLLSAL